METLTPATKIRSNTTYRIDHEITGMINVNDISNVEFYGGKLIGGYSLNGVTHGITFRDQEITGGNIGVQVRSEGSDIRFENMKMGNSTYAVWARPTSAGYLHNVNFDNCVIHNTKDDGIYVYKCHVLTLENSLIHKVNMNWKAPETDQKVAAGDGVQLILCDRITVEGNTIDRRATGNKFCMIFSGTAGSQNTPKVPDNFIRINNNKFFMPIRTGQGGAGLYFYDLPAEFVTEFTFNEVIGDLAGIKYTCLGTFYSNGNTYDGKPGSMPIAIELQKTAAKGYSVSDHFVNCTRKTTSNVQFQ